MFCRHVGTAALKRVYNPKIVGNTVILVLAARFFYAQAMTDSTIAPPPANPRFSSTNVSWLLDMRKDAMKTISSITFLVGKGGKGYRFSGDTAGSRFQHRRFRYRKSGGATVEPLPWNLVITSALSVQPKYFCLGRHRVSQATTLRRQKKGARAPLYRRLCLRLPPTAVRSTVRPCR